MSALERKLRDQLHRGVSRLLPGPPAGTAMPDWDARGFRVLILRYDVIGDLVLSTGMLRQIALSHPRFEIDVLARKWVAPVLDHFPYVRRVIPFDCSADKRYPSLSLLAHVRRQRYDVVVDGMSIRRSSPTSSVLFMIASRAPYRVGLKSTTNNFIFNVPVDPAPSRHHAEQSAVLARPFGIDLDTTDWRSELVITPAERAAADQLWASFGPGLRAFVNISVTDARNDWPDDRFVALIRHLQSRRGDAQVLVTGVARQAERIARVAKAAGAHGSTQSLREVIARVATSDLVITPDTGIVHVAAAFARPILGLYRVNTQMWTPYKAPSRTLHSEALVHALPLERARAALDELLEEQVGIVRA